MKKLFFTLALVLFPVQVWAAGCGCGSINAMISAAKSETIQAVNAYTAAEAQAIRSEILLAAQNIIGTIKSETATVVRALVALKESNVAAIKGQAVAGEAMKTEDLYGTAAQPSGLCGATSLGAGIQLGAQAGQEIHATMREKQFAYANTPGAKPVEFLHRIPMVTDAQKETPAGQTYAAARKVHEERLAAVTEALNHHVVLHAPTLPEDVTEWAQNQWSEAGGSGTPPGIVDGKLSEVGLYKLLSQMRVGNPNWFAQIATATDAGLLREMAVMQAFQMELARKNMELMDRLTVIAALSFLSRMEGTTGRDMDDLYARMVGAQQ